ncbi:unnamed protein product, partial [Prorocentrum cordatum]
PLGGPRGVARPATRRRASATQHPDEPPSSTSSAPSGAARTHHTSSGIWAPRRRLSAGGIAQGRAVHAAGRRPGPGPPRLERLRCSGPARAALREPRARAAMDGAREGTGACGAAAGDVVSSTGGTGDAARAPKAGAAAAGVAGGGAGAIKALRRSSGAERPPSASGGGSTAQPAAPQQSDAVTRTRSGEAPGPRRSSSAGVLSLRRPSSTSGVRHVASEDVERPAGGAVRRRSVGEALARRASFSGGFGEQLRRASFSVQVGNTLSGCETFAEALAAGSTRSGCAARTSSMTFSGVRRPQGDAHSGARRSLAAAAPLALPRDAADPVRASLQGKTLAEAIHSHNTHGAREERRVNAMSFSLKSRNFDQILRDAAVAGPRPISADRRLSVHVVRPLSASTPALHGRRRST